MDGFSLTFAFPDPDTSRIVADRLIDRNEEPAI
jgi:hypothetical protein